ncbi:recombinase family protein [Nonomuraea guangzhouensis]|uniref:Recombinase family protein n=1 Tax=Nonomuraea guangzhouensis TaxID=1291555 RepID=A0ABW4G7I3_9ACTN
MQGTRGVVLRVLSNFHDLAADDDANALIINVITAVGQFQRDLQNELTAEGIAAAEAEGRYPRWAGSK